jgi:hypothetical protein
MSRPRAVASASHVTHGHEGLRLLYWKTKDGVIEFANVGAKNDLEILE